MSRTALPVISPVVPTLRREVPRGPAWRYEPKLDGFRGTLYVQAGQAWFRSKRMNVMKRFQSLADTLASVLHVRDAILDGEIVVMREGMPDFYALMFRRGTPEFAAFDLVWLNGKDLRSLPYRARKTRLRKLLPLDGLIGHVESHREADLFEAAKRLDLEGIVAKRVSDPYGPNTEWVKVKHPSYSQREGRWELFDKSKR